MNNARLANSIRQVHGGWIVLTPREPRVSLSEEWVFTDKDEAINHAVGQMRNMYKELLADRKIDTGPGRIETYGDGSNFEGKA